MFLYSILLHWALILSFESYLLGLSIISSGEISMGAFHSLIQFCYVLCVLRVHVKVL